MGLCNTILWLEDTLRVFVIQACDWRIYYRLVIQTCDWRIWCRSMSCRPPPSSSRPLRPPPSSFHLPLLSPFPLGSPLHVLERWNVQDGRTPLPLCRRQHLRQGGLCVWVGMYVCECVYGYICMYVCMYVCIMCVWVGMYVCMYECMWVCVWVMLHMYAVYIVD